MRRWLLMGLLGSVAATIAAQAPAPQVLRIPAADAATRQQLSLWFGHLVVERDSGDVLVDADAYSRDRLRLRGIEYMIETEATAQLQRKLAALRGDPREIPGFACYRTVEDTLDTIDDLVATYPQLASQIDIGVSWRRTQDSAQGWPLRVLRLSNQTVGGDKPKLFAMSGMHAREYTTSELMTRFAEQLLAGYGSDADATWLLDHHEFHLLLAANPDGRKRAETGLLWRKNENWLDGACSPPNPPNNDGIDLNRNFPWGWNQFGGSDGDPCSDTFRGPLAASEPETQAVIDYVMQLFPDTRPGDSNDQTTPAADDTQGLFLDVHSFSQLVLWPWGGTELAAGNADQLARLGKRLAWINDYEPQQGVDLYPTDGTTTDFAYGELGLPAYTIELGIWFFEDCEVAESVTFPDNLKMLRYAARTLHAPYLLPAGPDADSLQLDATQATQGTVVTLSARIDDTRYRDPGPESPSHVIAGATVFLNRLPWHDGGPGLAMSAGDGSFNGTTEEVEVAIDTTRIPPGRHLLIVQGHDVASEYGPPAAIFLDVVADADRIFGNDFDPAPF